MRPRTIQPIAVTLLMGVLAACGGLPPQVGQQDQNLVTVDPGELSTMPEHCDTLFGPEPATWPQHDALYRLGESHRVLLVRGGAPLCVAALGRVLPQGGGTALQGRASLLSPTEVGGGQDDTADSNPLPAHHDVADPGDTADSNPLPAHHEAVDPGDTADSNPLPAHHDEDNTTTGTPEDSNPLPAHVKKDILVALSGERSTAE